MQKTKKGKRNFSQEYLELHRESLKIVIIINTEEMRARKIVIMNRSSQWLTNKAKKENAQKEI